MISHIPEYIVDKQLLITHFEELYGVNELINIHLVYDVSEYLSSMKKEIELVATETTDHVQETSKLINLFL